MAKKEIIKMSQKEVMRVEVIGQVTKGKMSRKEAAEVLRLSTRQVRRILKRVTIEGMKGLVHKSRGRKSNKAYPEKLKRKVLNLYKSKFKDFGPLLATEKLKSMHKIIVSDETLRQWLLASGDWQTRHKRKQHRQWRARREHFGSMVQMDGSNHDWLEVRGNRCVLMGYIDDATNNVYARFYEYEGTIPAMDSFRRYCEKYGVPASIYLDRHSTYKSTAKPQIEDLLNNSKPLSEFERAAKELGVNVIHANSPQAKGRVERLFGTFQDRLVKEMRLAGISAIEEANIFLMRYLPIFNKKFARMPAKNANMHKEAPSSRVLDSIFCIKTERVVKNDFTISYNNNVYQILENIIAKKVVVEERFNGKILLRHNGQTIRFKQIDPSLLIPRKPFVLKVIRRYVPPQNHPWRHLNYKKNEKIFQAGSPPNPPEGRKDIPNEIGHF